MNGALEVYGKTPHPLQNPDLQVKDKYCMISFPYWDLMKMTRKQICDHISATPLCRGNVGVLDISMLSDAIGW